MRSRTLNTHECAVVYSDDDDAKKSLIHDRVGYNVLPVVDRRLLDYNYNML